MLCKVLPCVLGRTVALQTCPEASYPHSVCNGSWSECLQQYIYCSVLLFFNQNMLSFSQPRDLQRPTASNEVLWGRFAKVLGGLPSQIEEKNLK